jgi:putative nucleotidyltransferase with HDIG domain
MDNNWRDSNMNILVVDDDPEIVEILADLLGSLDYGVSSAANGALALELIAEQEFDLLLTDINMPVMDGMELIRRVNDMEKSPMIIVITAYASMQSAIDAIKLGVYDYITKPFEFEIVANVVEKALERQFLQRENVNLKEMMALYRASESISAQFGLDEVIKVLFESAASFTQADFMALYLNDDSPANHEFSLIRRKLLRPPSKNTRYLLNLLPKHLSSAVAHEHFTSFSSKLFQEHDPLLASLVDDNGERVEFSSMMAFTLKARNRLVGVFILISFRPEIIFSDKLRRSFYMLVSKAAACIENSYLYNNLQQHYIETVESFAMALEAKDSYTHGHSYQVSRYAALMARQLGFSCQELALLQKAAILHDIGKIGVSDAVLGSQGELTESEFAEIRTHPLKGRKIIDPVSSLSQVAEVIFHHHEHWDGNGYPEGLCADEIPLMSRIIGVADAFDAMTSKRPYRSSLSIKEALIELRKGAGKQFDPELVEVFIALRYEVRNLLVEFKRSARTVVKDDISSRFRDGAVVCK